MAPLPMILSMPEAPSEASFPITLGWFQMAVSGQEEGEMVKCQRLNQANFHPLKSVNGSHNLVG